MKKNWFLSASEESEQYEGPSLAAGSSDDSKVSSEYNKIYFYSGVTRQENMQLNKLILTTGQKMKSIELCYRLPEPPKVYLHINSYGGSVFAGFGSWDRDWETPE